MSKPFESGTRFSFWIYIIAVLNIIFHLAFYNTLGFHRDELLYFSLGQHLSAGYASVPPFTGFIAWVMINTLGYSLLSARLVPMLLSGIIVMLGASIAKEMKGRTYAQILTAVAIIVSPFNLRGFSMLQPVCFDVFFWTLSFWLTLKWINTRSDKYLILLGLVAGLGLMNKYLILLELACILSVLLFTPYRTIFMRKAFYFAVLIAFVVFLPNIIWQIKNNLPVLIHMRALHDSQLVYVNRISFFTDQIFINFMALLLIIPGIFAFFFIKDLRPYRALVFSCLGVLIILAFLRGKSYYSGGLYPFLAAAGGVFWEIRTKRVFTRILLPFIMIVVTMPVVPMGIPTWKQEKLAEYFAGVKRVVGFDMVLRWENGRIHSLPQDYADMLGWDELAAITAKAFNQVHEKRSCMIYAENYGEAGSVMVIGKQFYLPEPACFSESFFYWFPRNPEYEINSLIYINGELGENISDLFANIRLIGRISNPFAREYGVGIWLCTNPKSSFNTFWKQRVTMLKSPFE